MQFFFWMVSIVLIVAGIYFLLQRQWIYAVVALGVGALIGPMMAPTTSATTAISHWRRSRK